MRFIAATRLLGNFLAAACQVWFTIWVINEFESAWRWLILVMSGLALLGCYRGGSLALRDLTSRSMDRAAE